MNHNKNNLRMVSWAQSILYALFLLASPLALHANNVKVSASLQPDQTTVGETAQLQVKVEGSAQAGTPPAIPEVNGLSIQYFGPATQISIVNGQRTQSVTFIFGVTANQTGTFNIPAIPVVVDNQTYQTTPLTFNVVKQVTAPGSTDSAGGQLAFIKVEVQKKDLYAGEIVPVHLKAYFSRRIQIRDGGLGMPSLKSEQVILTPLSNHPHQSMEMVDGENFLVFIFPTKLSAITAGEITLGPAQMEAILSIPQSSPRRRGWPFDDDFFGPPMEHRRIQMQSEPVTLHVKPLPGAGQPENFTGAVGKFSIDTSYSPQNVKVGDPVTLRVTIQGQGNFDQINQLQFGSTNDFQIYAPNVRFSSRDTLGYEGEKVFEQVLIPGSASVNSLPSVEFNYFDPEEHKYITLSKTPGPIAVEQVSQDSKTSPTLKSADREEERKKEVSRRADLVYIKTKAGKWTSSLRPSHQQKEFWLMQSIPASLVFLFAFMAWKQRRIEHNPELIRREKVLASLKEQMHRLENEANADQFVLNAIPLIREAAALKLNRSSASLTSDVLESELSRLNVDESIRAEIVEIFNLHDAMRFAGGKLATKISLPEWKQKLKGIYLNLTK